MTEDLEHSPPSANLLVAAALVPTVAFGVVVTAALLVLFGPLGLLGLVVTAVVVLIRARLLTRGIRDRVLGPLGPRPADPGDDAGLVNLAEGLSATSGVPLPDLFVLEESAANMLVIGEPSVTPALVVTSGLLKALDRVELESVVAWAFAEVRQGELPAATVAVTTVAPPAIRIAAGGASAVAVKPFSRTITAGYGHFTGPDRDLLLDQAAVALTRYPPGLRAALERMQTVGTTVDRAVPESAHLWMADPGVSIPGTASRPALELRVEALGLL